MKLVDGDWGGMGSRVDFADCLIPYSRYTRIYPEAYIDVQQNIAYIPFTYDHGV